MDGVLVKNIINSNSKAMYQTRRYKIQPIVFPSSEPEESSSQSKIQKTEWGIGCYTYVKKIGYGTYGSVKLAYHNTTREAVAIKILQKPKMEITQIEKMYREMKILKMLDHPNIVKLYQVIETDEKFYLVMEYVDGGELYDKIKNYGPMLESDARELIKQLVSAIQYCHSKGIAHRDLKLENILLDKAGKNIKLIDFGFSTFTSHYTKLSTFCGSPPYAAPELFQGVEYNGFKSDVWALGCIIFTIIAGSLPFDGNSVKSIKSKVETANFKIPPKMSVPCEILIKHCLTVDPIHRVNIYEVMRNRWIIMNSGLDELAPYVEPNKDTIDDRKVAKLLKMGFKRPEIEESITQKKYNEIFALYTMIREEDLPKEQGSPAKKSKPSQLQEKVNLKFLEISKARSAQKDMIQTRSQKASIHAVNKHKLVRPENTNQASFSSIRRNILALDSRSRLIENKKEKEKAPEKPLEDSAVNQENNFIGWTSKPKDLELKSPLVRNTATRSTFHSTNSKKPVDLKKQETPAKQPAFLRRLISKLDINFRLFSSKKDVANNK